MWAGRSFPTPAFYVFAKTGMMLSRMQEEEYFLIDGMKAGSQA